MLCLASLNLYVKIGSNKIPNKKWFLALALTQHFGFSFGWALQMNQDAPGRVFFFSSFWFAPHVWVALDHKKHAIKQKGITVF